MTNVTTATVLVSGSAWGPSGAPGWRIGWVMQLVENGSATWLIDKLNRGHGSAGPERCPVGGRDSRHVVESIVLTIAACTADENLMMLLEESTNVRVESDGRRLIAEAWEVVDDLWDRCCQHVSSMQLAILVLDRQSLVNEAVVADLRRLGIAVAYADCSAGARA